jgi:DNA replication and repair protein RecF
LKIVALVMHLRKLRTYQFRNIADGEMTLENGLVSIIGRNGNGKTNIVEAISFLSNGKSLRAAASDEMVRIGTEECSVFGEVVAGDLSLEVGVNISGKKRSGFINGQLAKTFAEYVGRLVVVSFVPNDLDLVQGAPSGRRGFVDRHLVDLKPHILKVMVDYRRALAHKSMILKGGNCSAHEIEPWNRVLAQNGAELCRERYAFTQRLESLANEIHSSFAPSDGSVRLRWKGEAHPDTHCIEEGVFTSLMNHAHREIAAGMPLFGPHRDDLRLWLGEREVSRYGSQGQVRSIVLSLKLGVIRAAQEQLGTSPVVLLDDVNSELDRTRAEAFFDHLIESGRQIFFTGTEVPNYQLKAPFVQRLEVVSGSIFDLSGALCKAI